MTFGYLLMMNSTLAHSSQKIFEKSLKGKRVSNHLPQELVRRQYQNVTESRGRTFVLESQKGCFTIGTLSNQIITTENLYLKTF